MPNLISEKSNQDVDIVTSSILHDPSDPLDPHNWSPWKKRSVFLALMSSSILCDGGMTWGATLFVAQTFEWHISIPTSSTSMNYGILLQGFGGVFAVPFIEHFGRYPVWFWTQVLALACVIGATLAPSFASFVAFRSLQGLFGTVPQVIGLPIIHDMYDPEDWPRKINIWDTTFLVGPFLGPALAGYLANVLDWRGCFAVLAGLYGASTAIVLVFGRETYYAPNYGSLKAPTFTETLFGRGGALAFNRPSFARTSEILFLYIFRVPMLLVGFATLCNFTWPIGITVTIDSFIRAPPYLMDNTSAGSMRWAAIFGALAGWLIGYLFNEWISKHRVHRPDWRPEYRLHGVWVPLFCLVWGLLTYGLTINFDKSWVGIAFGWFGVNIGLVGTMVAITAFALEKYSEQATVVSAILNMWRTCGGFSVSYFQSAWIARAGVAVVFGCQAAIVAVTVVCFVATTIVIGKKKI
ncbi:putative MFS transporter [Halenospora varia]|nr:putative MFS transporter [Halenospora varia]